jgi:hypothetical protein
MNDGLYITWGDHQWFQRKARQLELVSGESVFLRLPGDDDDRELQVAELRVLTEVRHIEVTAAPVILSSPAAFKTRGRPRNRSRIGLVLQRGNVARPGTKRLNTTPALGDPV